MASFKAACKGDVDSMESSGDRSILFWDTNLESDLIDTVEVGYIDTCTVTGDAVVRGDLGPLGLNQTLFVSTTLI